MDLACSTDLYTNLANKKRKKKHCLSWHGKSDNQIKTVVVKLGDCLMIPGTHMVDGESWILNTVH